MCYVLTSYSILILNKFFNSIYQNFTLDFIMFLSEIDNWENNLN